MFTIYQLLIIIKVLSTSNKLKQEAKENRDIRSIVFPIKIYHNFHMIMNPADAMMQRSVKSVHSSDLSRETRKRFFPKRIMSEQEARVACKTRRWQTAAPHTSTDLHSCLKSVFSALKGSLPERREREIEIEKKGLWWRRLTFKLT